jgi:hypothetical protein
MIFEPYSFSFDLAVCLGSFITCELGLIKDRIKTRSAGKSSSQKLLLILRK